MVGESEALAEATRSMSATGRFSQQVQSSITDGSHSDASALSNGTLAQANLLPRRSPCACCRGSIGRCQDATPRARPHADSHVLRRVDRLAAVPPRSHVVGARKLDSLGSVRALVSSSAVLGVLGHRRCASSCCKDLLRNRTRRSHIADMPGSLALGHLGFRGKSVRALTQIDCGSSKMSAPGRQRTLSQAAEVEEP